MIIYESSNLSFIFRLEGSAIPKAVLYSLPSVAIAVTSHYMRDAYKEQFKFIEKIDSSTVFSLMVVIVSLVLAVRTNKAYGRFWEGITLVQQMRAEWFEAASNLIAFSMVSLKKSPKDIQIRSRVLKFQFTLVRLMSLMHGAALRQIGGGQEEFEVLEVQALDETSLRYLAECEQSDINRVEVLLHWIQVLVTDSSENGVMQVKAPILTRAYQTLSRGMVNLHNARKLADVPFPFPLSQFIIVSILMCCIFVPLYAAIVVKDVTCAAVIGFVPIFGMWTITFVAGELEQPFGSDPNDLPLSVLQYDFNMTLLMLLDEEANRAPRLCGASAVNAQLLWEALGDPEQKSMTNTYKDKYAGRVTVLSACFPGADNPRWSIRKSRPGKAFHKANLKGSHKKQLAFRKRRLNNRSKSDLDTVFPSRATLYQSGTVDLGQHEGAESAALRNGSRVEGSKSYANGPLVTSMWTDTSSIGHQKTSRWTETRSMGQQRTAKQSFNRVSETPPPIISCSDTDSEDDDEPLGPKSPKSPKLADQPLGNLVDALVQASRALLEVETARQKQTKQAQRSDSGGTGSGSLGADSRKRGALLKNLSQSQSFQLLETGSSSHRHVSLESQPPLRKAHTLSDFSSVGDTVVRFSDSTMDLSKHFAEYEHQQHTLSPSYHSSGNERQQHIIALNAHAASMLSEPPGLESLPEVSDTLGDTSEGAFLPEPPVCDAQARQPRNTSRSNSRSLVAAGVRNEAGVQVNHQPTATFLC